MRRDPTTRPCMRCGTPFRTAGRRPDARFCTRACADQAKRLAVAERSCARPGCDRSFVLGPRNPRQRYCSTACSGQARAQQVERTCPGCRERFWVAARRLAAGRGEFCSSRCYGAVRWGPRQLWTCRGCGVQAERSPTRAARPYCSQRCYFGHRGQATARRCATCQAPIRVAPSVLARGLGKFCSRACYLDSRRRPRVTRECEHCRQAFAVVPSQQRRRFCRRQCWQAATAPRRLQCRACRGPLPRRLWAGRHFCSRACANRGRHRERPQELSARDRRILALHAEGLRAPAILQRLGSEQEAWGWYTPAAVRQVISRARRGGDERTVTLPKSARRVTAGRATR